MTRVPGILVATILLSCVGRESDPKADSPVATDSTVAPALAAIDSGAPKLQPRDEANESFREFRERALAALARRDTAFLHGFIAPTIRTSFGDDGGLESFKTMWKTAEASSEVWVTLSRVLRMGGQQSSDTTFVAPYVFAFWPDSMDAFSHVAVTTQNASVHAEPRRDAPVVGTASYSIGRAVEWTNTPGDVTPSDTSWVRVEWRDRKAGWLRVEDAYSPVSWRAAFVRQGGRWMMILFVAGD